VKQKIKVIDNAIETQRMKILSIKDTIRCIPGHQLNLPEHGNEKNPLQLK
jgi:hypothetical protein